MKVATYARVSTGRQEKEKTIRGQMMEINDKIAKEGHTVIQRYFDDGWPGTILARPGLDQLRLDATIDAWQALVVYDPDRLARKNHYIQVLLDEFESRGKLVYFVTMPEVKNDQDRLLLGVRGLFAEFERAKITERFRMGKLRKARDGHVMASSAPYGYDYLKRDDHNQGHYEINPGEARLVRKIFGWVADEGLTIRKVVRRLQELDIKPRKSIRGVWNTSTLTTMLRNETYIGHAHYLKSEAIEPKHPIKHEKYKRIIKTSRKLRSREEWVDIPVPSIIEEPLFWKVRRQLEQNYEVCKRNRINDYLLAGKIYCNCGRKRNGEGEGGSAHLYYRCTDRHYSFPQPSNCTAGGINAVVADALVWRGVSDFMSDADRIKSQLYRYFKQHEESKVAVPAEREQIQKEIAELGKKESRFLVLYGDERISHEQLDSQMQDIKQRKHSLDRELASLPDISMTTLPTEEEIEFFAMKARAKLKSLNFQAKRDILLKLVDKVIGDQDSLTVSGFLPLGEPLTGYLDHRNVVYGSIGRNRRTAECGEEHAV